MAASKAWLMATTVLVAELALATASAAQEAPEGVVEEVIVTGSRIARRDYDANSPIVTVGEETLQKTGSVTVDTALTQMPQFVAATGSTTNSNNNGGQANVQLRGLGRARTLVLLDGRRLPPAGSDGSVDLNSLPSALIQNVEIITGGASAVYGSDAVAGVVNLRTRTSFEGFEFNAQYGVSEKGDAADYKMSVIAGGKFAEDRGRFLFSAEYAERESVLVSDRDWTFGNARDAILPEGWVTFAVANQPSQAAIDAVFGRYGIGAGVVRPANNFGTNADGTLFSTGLVAANYRGPTDSEIVFRTGSQILADGRRFKFLQIPLERYSIYSRVNYDLAENVRSYLQVLYTHNTASIQLNPAPIPGNRGISGIPVTNPFIPADLRALLAARPNPTATFDLSKRFDQFGGRRSTSSYETFQVVGGVKGALPIMDWTYELSATYGSNSVIRTQYPAQSVSALLTLVRAPDGGRSICEGGYNPFGDTPTSAACTNYINKRPKSLVQIDQEVLEANVQGGLFDLPAGELRFAAGASYRKDGFTTDPDPLIAAADILAASGAYFKGSTAVTEGYVETLVPLLRDLPFIQELSADLGFRLSDYNSIGRVQTYKADFSWKVVDTLRLRGGYERAIRAPNIGELFEPQTRGTTIIGLAGNFGSGDPCDIRGAYRRSAQGASVRSLCLQTGVPTSVIDTFSNSQQSAPNLAGGNPDLQEETADTYSVGAVWSPQFSSPLFENLSVSVDYYSIKVKDAVGQITASLILARCYNADGKSNPNYELDNFFCSNITRDASGQLFEVRELARNLGGYRTAGIDAQIDWRFGLGAIGLSDDYGSLDFNFAGTYLDSFKIQSLPADPFLDYAGTIGNGQVDPVAISRPEWKFVVDAGYSLGPVDLGLRWRYIGKMSSAANVGTTGTSPGIPAVSYFDFNARYKLRENLVLWGVVNNLADKTPPVFPVAGSTDLAAYDAIGRRITVGLKASF